MVATWCSLFSGALFVSVTSRHVTQTAEGYSSRMLRQMTDLHMTRSQKEVLIEDQIVFLISCSAFFFYSFLPPLFLSCVSTQKLGNKLSTLAQIQASIFAVSCRNAKLH